MSTCLININNYKSAIFYLEKILKISNGGDGESEYRLGICYYQLNNKVKGCYYIDQAVLKNYPNSINIRDKYCK
jgi:tetratricopeptide (TPR) repeat protein